MASTGVGIQVATPKEENYAGFPNKKGLQFTLKNIGDQHPLEECSEPMGALAGAHDYKTSQNNQS